MSENIVRALIVLIIVLAFGACGAGCAACASEWDISDGERHGSIVKVSEKGIFWTTREAQLVRSGEGIATMEPWDFSVTDDAVWQMLHEVAESGERVKVLYHQVMWNLPWVAGTPYIVHAVERHKAE